MHIDLYHGYYGLTLRIATGSRNTLTNLKNIFAGLSGGSIKKYSFTSVDYLRVTGCDAIIVSVKNTPGEYLGIQKSPLRIEVFWQNDSSGWSRVVDLIDGLLRGGKGHQYLEDCSEELVIELSYRE
ncbi:MAG: hypothetical protein ACF8MJ_11525 [Phycisphaerales bacterium JB050]